MSDPLLIELVQRYVFLYDKGHRFYKNKVARTNAWQSIGHKIGESAADAENRFGVLRNRYSFEKRKQKIPPSGDGKDATVSNWRHFNALRFLDQHIKPRRSNSYFRSREDVYIEETDTNDVVEDYKISIEEEMNEDAIFGRHPHVEDPLADEPIVHVPIVNAPLADEPIADKPIVDEPLTDEPLANEHQHVEDRPRAGHSQAGAGQGRKSRQPKDITSVIKNSFRKFGEMCDNENDDMASSFGKTIAHAMRPWSPKKQSKFMKDVLTLLCEHQE